MAEWLAETLYEGWGQRFKIVEVLARERSEFQDIVVFQSVSHGRVLVLDGCIQITEADEFVYQEMLAHVPILAHGAARRVLIIGAGDGGILRQVLRHQDVAEATMIEIDEAVIRLTRQHMPGIAGDAWDDPRANVIVGDGIDFVRTAASGSFDVIIVDSTDPAGVGETLFTEAFYLDCARILTSAGIIVNQAGVPFMQAQELTETSARRRRAFELVTAYVAAVPTYVGGLMALGFASNNRAAVEQSAELIRTRAGMAGLLDATSYWTPEVQVASFHLPPYVAKCLS